MYYHISYELAETAESPKGRLSFEETKNNFEQEGAPNMTPGRLSTPKHDLTLKQQHDHLVPKESNHSPAPLLVRNGLKEKGACVKQGRDKKFRPFVLLSEFQRKESRYPQEPNVAEEGIVAKSRGYHSN